MRVKDSDGLVDYRHGYFATSNFVLELFVYIIKRHGGMVWLRRNTANLLENVNIATCVRGLFFYHLEAVLHLLVY